MTRQSQQAFTEHTGQLCIVLLHAAAQTFDPEIRKPVSRENHIDIRNRSGIVRRPSDRMNEEHRMGQIRIQVQFEFRDRVAHRLDNDIGAQDQRIDQQLPVNREQVLNSAVFK